MTRGDIKTNIRTNLADAGVTFYSEDDLNDSIQDAYDDIACLSQCILKKVTLNWSVVANLVYIDHKIDQSITDYMGVVAIFNNNTNFWLRDDCSLKDLDRVRRDWENWTGQPQFWCPSDPQRVVVAPHFLTGTTTGTYDLYYWGLAPTLSSDSDTFLIAADMQQLLEFYVTGDLLEQAQEYKKALGWLTKYYPVIQDYKERVERINKADLLLRV